MQNPELFIHLAEIAGVFVGFGALIAVRSGGASGPLEVGFMRSMVTLGVLVVVAGLAPVTLGFFDLADHQIWALSSIVFLAGIVVLGAAVIRTPEYRANVSAWRRAARTQSPSRWIAVGETAATFLSLIAMVLIPVVILLGVAPDLEAGLYFALVALVLINAAWLLLDLVYQRPRPDSA